MIEQKLIDELKSHIAQLQDRQATLLARGRRSERISSLFASLWDSDALLMKEIHITREIDRTVDHLLHCPK